MLGFIFSVGMNHFLPTHEMPPGCLFCCVLFPRRRIYLVLTYLILFYLISSYLMDLNRSEFSAHFSLSGCTLVT